MSVILAVIMECDEIEVDHLIALVEARPLLWDKSLADNKNRLLVNFAWREVWCYLHNNFEALSDLEKNEFGKFVVLINLLHD